jgi:hypothetical protein
MDQINKYFTAEKNESLLFVLVGLAAIGVSVYFLLKIKEPFYNGVSYPLMAIALIQIVVGGSVFVRSPKDIIRVNNIVQQEQTKIQSEEIPRMQVVMKNFATYKWIEIGLLIIGILLFALCQKGSLTNGIGLGLLIQSAFMLLLDFFAESRGKTYLQYLQSII